ncbi:hypothetical protein LCM23_19945 [Cytobacillus kochii]|uniref:hypothetical protein n=1 Tax=Cytobacillus kochii TaxID=859143 RepID=UPI001CD198B5|nr:hypothetical protein [Cytobacillus kochii]MCA1028340.1 hypothetical protein [Cytobacillus kochii]
MKNFIFGDLKITLADLSDQTAKELQQEIERGVKFKFSFIKSDGEEIEMEVAETIVEDIKAFDPCTEEEIYEDDLVYE